MFNKIITPVDLAHIDKLGRALDCAADLAKHYGLPIIYVGVTSSAPGAIAHNPEEYTEKLQNFVDGEVEKYGVDASAHMEKANDPSIEIEAALIKAIDKTGADLVVMASHVPGAVEYVWPSNGGKVAQHAKCSVMLVRP